MMNNLDIPTNFKVIGFGKEISSIALEKLRGYGYDGVSIIDANEKDEIIPTDDDKMAIILVGGDEGKAADCARIFYQAGVLTVAVTCNGLHLPENSCDTQTHIRENELSRVTVAILDIIFNGNGYISLDFNDLQTCLKDSTKFAITKVRGIGESRVEEALAQIKDIHPHIGLNTIENIIIAVYFDKESERPLGMSEMSGITKYIETLPEDVYAIYGLFHHNAVVPTCIDVVLIMSGKELQV